VIECLNLAYIGLVCRAADSQTAVDKEHYCNSNVRMAPNSSQSDFPSARAGMSGADIWVERHRCLK